MIDDAEQLARELYRGYCRWSIERMRVAPPRWEHLHEDLQDFWRTTAQDIIDNYEEFHASGN